MQMTPAVFKLRIGSHCPNRSKFIFQACRVVLLNLLLQQFLTIPQPPRLNHLVILRDAEEAAYFHNTLENITSALDIFYFPSSFKNKKNYRLLNSSHVMLRTEALTKIQLQAILWN